MGKAFDHTFRASIPGSSLAYRYGTMPHSRPPKYVNPNDALEFIWKQLHQKKMLKTIWYYFEQGGTVWHMTKVILYKLAVSGIIQMNLAIVIYPIVGQMLSAIANSKGIKPILYPKFKDSTKDMMVNQHIENKLGQQHGNLPKSALANTQLSAKEITDSAEGARMLAKNIPSSLEQNKPAPQGLLNTGAQ